MTLDSRILTITDAALEKLLEIRSTEPDADDLAFVLAVSGAKDDDFTYTMHMTSRDRLAEDDILEQHGELPVAMPQASVANLTGASLEMSTNLLLHPISVATRSKP